MLQQGEGRFWNTDDVQSPPAGVVSEREGAREGPPKRKPEGETQKGTLLHAFPGTRGRGIMEAGTQLPVELHPPPHSFRSRWSSQVPASLWTLRLSIPLKLGYKRPLELCGAKSFCFRSSRADQQGITKAGTVGGRGSRGGGGGPFSSPWK